MIGMIYLILGMSIGSGCNHPSSTATNNTLSSDNIAKERKTWQYPDYKPSTKYSFIVAGHPYTLYPDSDVPMNPVFMDHFDTFKEDTILKFLTITGDATYDGSYKSFDLFLNALNEINKPYHFAPGNHDISYDEFFNQRYKSFVFENDLFIFLDSNQGWSIKDDQLDFLSDNLAKATLYDNIFIFIHHVIWYNKFENVKVNSFANIQEPVNFQSTIEPLLKSAKKPIYMFSGDVGAWNNPAYYYRDGDIRYIASGMSNRKDIAKENYLRIDVSNNKSVTIQLLGLSHEKSKDLKGSLDKYEMTLK